MRDPGSISGPFAGMARDTVFLNGSTPIEEYALVVYIPAPLGPFFDQLRGGLEPDSLFPRAHVTVLPPRPLRDGRTNEDAWRELEAPLLELPAINVAAGRVEIFPVTNVVYLAVEAGFQQFLQLHDRLNHDSVAFTERYPYHPHITLAQGLEREQAEEVRSRAQAAWDGYGGPRSFEAARYSFVQNTACQRWLDLHEIDISSFSRTA